MTPFKTILAAAELNAKVKHYPKGYYATLSPLRNEHNPSLLFGESPNGRPWFKDLATDTDPPAILRAWGINPDTLETEVNDHIKPPRRQPGQRRRLFLNFNRPDATYHYTHADGSPCYQVRRVNFTRPDGSKDKEFRQYHWADGRYQPGRGETPELLYNLPQVIKAEVVIICEGEKDADNLNALGYVATTHAGGAKNISKALPSYRQWLHDKLIVILPDNDRPGQDMARALANGLHGIVAGCLVVPSEGWGEQKADVSDLIDRLRTYLLNNEEIKAELDRIFYHAPLWGATRPTQPGPKTLERLAARDKYLAEAKQRREEWQARQTAHYLPDVIPFVIADDQDYINLVYQARQTYNSAADWKERVMLDFPELDPDHEYKTKLAENRERKIAFCGKPFKRLTATGEIKPGRIMCGLCESCKKIDRANLRQALESVILDSADLCLTVLTVSDKTARAKITRRLRESDTPYKCFPIATDSGSEYDILLAGSTPAVIVDCVSQEIILAQLTDGKLDRWLSRPEGGRSSGDMIPSLRELRQDAGERDKWECEADNPDSFELTLPGLICEGELPEVYTEEEVSSVDTLQAAIYEMADQQRLRLAKRGHVIYGVIIKKSYYALNDIPAICEEFNRLNSARRQRIEARRTKKRE